MRRRLLLLAPLAACGGPAGPVFPTPSSLNTGVGDPPTAAIGVTAFVFGQPRSVWGRPADAADAIAQLEWLTVILATDQRFIGMPALVQPNMVAGRNEVRAAFGIAPAYPAADAVDGFDATARALRRGDVVAAEAALLPMVGADRVGRALDILANLPAFPRAAFATAEAQRGQAAIRRRQA